MIVKKKEHLNLGGGNHTEFSKNFKFKRPLSVSSCLFPFCSVRGRREKERNSEEKRKLEEEKIKKKGTKEEEKD